MKLQGLLLVLLIVSVNLLAQLPSYVPSNGLVGWYDFNGNANDLSSIGNNGIVYNATLASDRYGNPNKAYYFNGTNAYIECVNTPTNISNGYTYAVWVQSDLTSYSDMNVFTQLGPNPSCSTTNTNSSFGFSGASCYYYRHRGSNCTFPQLGNNAITQDWAHLVITWDLNFVRCYKNGVLIGVYQVSNSSQPGSTLRIGNGSTNPAPIGYFFKGRVDDAGIWNRPLTGSEVEMLFLASQPYQSSSVNTVTACELYTWPVNNQTYTQSGFYSFNYNSINGCDSTAFLNLTINNVFTKIDTVTSCNQYIWPVNGQSYNIDGTYTNLLQTQFGCDSSMTLFLTINSSNRDTTSVSICSGSSYLFEGNQYSIQGIYSSTLSNSAGCDSVRVLLLSVDNTYSDTNNISICPDTWHILPNADTVKAEQELKMPTITGTYLRLGKMCTPCHTSESLGGELMANNMMDKNQTALFKVPSLINTLKTAPYMHDGRFKTPKEILQHYDKNIHLLHKANKHLGIDSIPNIFTRFDREHFEELLQLFNDTTITHNEAYSNPFKQKDFSWQQLIKD